MLYLELRSPGRAQHWPLPTGQRVIGRTADCAIVVDEPSISRRHLRLTVSGDAVQLEDLGSTNGLWIDGKRVEAATITPGQWFSTGSLLFTIREGVSVSSLDLATSVTSDASQGSPAVTRLDRDTPASLDAGYEHLLRLFGLAHGPASEAILDAMLRAVASAARCRGGTVLARTASGWHVIVTTGETVPDTLSAAIEVRESQGPLVRDMNGTPVLVLPIMVVGTLGGLVLLHPAPAVVPVGADILVDLAAEVIRSRGEDVEGSQLAAARERATLPDPGYVAASESGRDLLAQIDRLAVSDLPILLAGESGTGKELLAHRLHRRSRRRNGPFIALNCSAFAKDLVEAELFGIHRGVATGVSERTGRFLQASGGTLLLDEIGDLPLELQPKLLRALEAGEILPVGAPHPLRVDVRVVSATHMDLKKAVAEGRFRQDLLYRLGAEVLVPPLRHRPEDILPLARHFAREAARAQSRRFFGIDLDAAKLLLGYAWPGNVRELKHVVARAVALADGAVLHTELLTPEIRADADVRLGDALLGLREDWKTAGDRFGRLYFTQLIERCSGNLSEAARIAGIGRSTLYAKLQELGIDLPER